MSGEDLQRFQTSADTHSLLRHVQQTGKSPQEYQETAELLSEVFDALAGRKKPAYSRLDVNALRAHESAVGDILRWLADSEDSAIRVAAIELMGIIGVESFIPDLSRRLSSENKQERLAAIGSLGEIVSERSTESLKEVIQDPDPEVRTAVAAAFFNLSDKL